MTWTKLILTLYPALLVTSLHLSGRGMADQRDFTPRPDEWAWLIGISICVPAVHLFALRRITYDRWFYRVSALLGIPFIILPFFGLVIGLSVYGVLTYLLFARSRHHAA